MEFCNGQLCYAAVDDQQFVDAPTASVLVKQHWSNQSRQPKWFRVWLLHSNARIRWQFESWTSKVCRPLC